jgi:hypothetical protein
MLHDLFYGALAWCQGGERRTRSQGAPSGSGDGRREAGELRGQQGLGEGTIYGPKQITRHRLQRAALDRAPRQARRQDEGHETQ